MKPVRVLAQHRARLNRVLAQFWHSRGKGTAKAMECRSMDSFGISRRLVGAGRFERPTPCAQGRCATRLRYAPTFYSFLDFRPLSLFPILSGRPNRTNIAPTVTKPQSVDLLRVKTQVALVRISVQLLQSLPFN